MNAIPPTKIHGSQGGIIGQGRKKYIQLAHTRTSFKIGSFTSNFKGTFGLTKLDQNIVFIQTLSE
jgi:hypothetical protein